MSVIIAPSSDLNVDACYFMYGPWGNSGRGTIALFGDSPQESNNNPWWRNWQDGADTSNSQCTVKGSAMTKTPSGNDLIVTIPIVASSLMIGTYNIFLSTGSWNFSAPNGYWKPIATTPPRPTTSVMPGSGTGMSATYDVTISSAGVDKSRALSRSLFFVNQYFSGAGGCYLIYQNTNRQLIMLKDDGNEIATNGLRFLGTTPGASQIASNTQCVMDLGQITYADPGTNDVTLHIPVAAFTEGFRTTGPATKGVYSVPIDRAGNGPHELADSEWDLARGTCAATAGFQPYYPVKFI